MGGDVDCGLGVITVELPQPLRHACAKMSTVGFTYWKDGDMWLGYLDEFPDYMTQGVSVDDLKEHLLDLYKDLSSGLIPSARRHAELQIE